MADVASLIMKPVYNADGASDKSLVIKTAALWCVLVFRLGREVAET